MELNFNQLLEKVTNFIQNEAQTETVIGKEFKLGEFACVPVIRVAMGFGSGGGEGTDAKGSKGQGGGAGAGVNISPIGFLVTKGDDITFLHAGKSKGLAAVFEKIPDLLEKVIDSKKEEKKEPALES